MKNVDSLRALFIGQSVEAKIGSLKGNRLNLEFLLNPFHRRFTETTLSIGEDDYLRHVYANLMEEIN
jgi:hypothetical protein